MIKVLSLWQCLSLRCLQPQKFRQRQVDSDIAEFDKGCLQPQKFRQRQDVPYRPLDDEDGVYNPKNLGNDKRVQTKLRETKGVYNPKNLGNDKAKV